MYVIIDEIAIYGAWVNPIQAVENYFKDDIVDGKVEISEWDSGIKDYVERYYNLEQMVEVLNRKELPYMIKLPCDGTWSLEF